jgi:hypothetical protein
MSLKFEVCQSKQIGSCFDTGAFGQHRQFITHCREVLRAGVFLLRWHRFPHPPNWQPQVIGYNMDNRIDSGESKIVRFSRRGSGTTQRPAEAALRSEASQGPPLDESLRLIRAFTLIKDPAERARLIEYAETTAGI